MTLLLAAGITNNQYQARNLYNYLLFVVLVCLERSFLIHIVFTSTYHYAQYMPLLFPCTTVSTPIIIVQMFHLFKHDLRLILHDPELADPVIDLNPGIPQSIDRHKPLVIVSAIRTVDHTLMIRLDYAEILKG